MSQHTPTPWTVDEALARDNRVISGPNGEVVVEVAATLDHDSTSDLLVDHERDANAAFIVRACNAYDDLLAALREIVRLADANATDQHDMAVVRAYAVDAARAALRKATEEGN